MTHENAIREIPNYAAAELPLPEIPKEPKTRRFFDPQDFTRRYGILLVIAAAFTIYTICLSAIVEHRTEKRVTREVTEAVTSELRRDFQAYLDQQEEDRKAAQFLTGDASKEAAVEELAGWFDELISTYAQDFGLREDALYGLGWTFIARYMTASPEFGVTPQEIIERANAWEGKVVGHGVRNQDTEIARSIARDFLNGNYPDGWTQNMVFGSREAGGGWVARTEYKTGPNTAYWRYQR